MSSAVMDDEKYEELRDNLAEYWENINAVIKNLKPGEPGYGTAAMGLGR